MPPPPPPAANKDEQPKPAGAGAGSDLPPLSAKEFRVYNRMAEHMDQFHTHFRLTYNTLLSACATPPKPKLAPRALITQALEFCHHLTMHHTIEERHIFPVLARRMPEFRRELSLLSQHKEIHRGMAALERYLEACRSGETDLDRREVGRLLEGFGGVLFEHLDEEVHALRAENMRVYWSEREMAGLPM
ncbi:hemerythrin domain-containing protein [Aspergillus saccharolyticus JOP 1030-1]|uniref:Hemerythrin-like domain-containing protein n=1 Tax=Aspergillus saccharolyticus JOP 1030-1 TaxID=1450539 RepID=A0A318ZIW0_9EURO|nr:hypothetical protein BP01DRAFT_300480 [Aspergillus saccharolyticus JOP 1030-1]PYH43650.1 hypothetical protein BP01DRAFT_300480 [Aspergillus saccharolyticus JOP 1030-1]